MIRNRTRKTYLVMWLAIAQSFVAHAIVPGLTLRPAVAGQGSVAHGRDAAIVRSASPASRATSVCRIKASKAGDSSHLPGRRGRTDRCRAFFIAYKATPTKGPLDCLMIGLADYVRPLDTSTTASLDAVWVSSPACFPPAAFTSLTIELCRPRC